MTELTEEEYLKVIDQLKCIPLEQEYFLWEGWDSLGGSDYQFYSCELIKDIGNIKAGTKFPVIRVCYDQSLLEIYASENDSYPSALFKLSLQIKKLA